MDVFAFIISKINLIGKYPIRICLDCRLRLIILVTAKLRVGL